MEKNIECLIAACDRLNLTHRFVDANQHFLLVDEQHFFEKNRTPFNTEAMAAICKDKEHHYRLLHNQLSMPDTMGFLDPNTDPKYHKYLDYHSVDAIVAAIETRFGFPVVVKQNKGALGINVFCCETSQQIRQAITTIFNKHSKDYDYVALAQQFVKTQQELRIVYFDGEPQLSYQRFFADTTFGARYWETDQGQAINIADSHLVQRCSEAFAPAINLPGLRFVALDIILDENNDLYLIELNSGPKFTHFTQANGDEMVIDMYSRILPQFLAT